MEQHGQNRHLDALRMHYMLNNIKKTMHLKDYNEVMRLSDILWNQLEIFIQDWILSDPTKKYMISGTQPIDMWFVSDIINWTRRYEESKKLDDLKFIYMSIRNVRKLIKRELDEN